jgi:hypothetical protein
MKKFILLIILTNFVICKEIEIKFEFFKMPNILKSKIEKLDELTKNKEYKDIIKLFLEIFNDPLSLGNVIEKDGKYVGIRTYLQEKFNKLPEEVKNVYYQNIKSRVKKEIKLARGNRCKIYYDILSKYLGTPYNDSIYYILFQHAMDEGKINIANSYCENAKINFNKFYLLQPKKTLLKYENKVVPIKKYEIPLPNTLNKVNNRLAEFNAVFKGLKETLLSSPGFKDMKDHEGKTLADVFSIIEQTMPLTVPLEEAWNIFHYLTFYEDKMFVKDDNVLKMYNCNTGEEINLPEEIRIISDFAKVNNLLFTKDSIYVLGKKIRKIDFQGMKNLDEKILSVFVDTNRGAIYFVSKESKGDSDFLYIHKFDIISGKIVFKTPLGGCRSRLIFAEDIFSKFSTFFDAFLPESTKMERLNLDPKSLLDVHIYSESENVYILLFGIAIACVDNISGSIKWMYQFSSKASKNIMKKGINKVIIDDENEFLLENNNLVFIDRNGEKKILLNNLNDNTNLIGISNRILYFNDTNKIFGYDIENQKISIEFPYQSTNFISNPIIDKNFIYLIRKDGVDIISPSNFTILSQIKIPAIKIPGSNEEVSYPIALYDGKLYIITVDGISCWELK